VLFIILVFIYNYWCPTRFLYQITCLSFNRNTTSVRCLVRLYLPLFVGGFMSYLRYWCLLVHSCVQHMLCCNYWCPTRFLYQITCLSFNRNTTSVLFLLFKVLSVRLVFTASNYPLCILKNTTMHKKHNTTCVGHNYAQTPLFVGGFISDLRYWCLLVYSCVQHMLCCVFCA
jgi:hypothetical protein